MFPKAKRRAVSHVLDLNVVLDNTLTYLESALKEVRGRGEKSGC
jgi:hypothetical protein